MSNKVLIEQSLNVSDMLMDKYLGDIEPAAFLVRPVPEMNHLAWQIGHLLLTERKFVETLKPGSSPDFPAGFDAKHARDKHGDDDPTGFLPKDEYLKLWKAQRAATRAVLATMSEGDLDAPNPDEHMRSMAPTVGALFNIAGLHALMHAGQFVAIRRAQALPIAF